VEGDLGVFRPNFLGAAVRWPSRAAQNSGVDPVTRGWAVVTSAGVARLGLGFVASLLIARALGPADFGVYAVLAATVAIVNTLAEGGLTEAAVLRISAVWPAGSERTSDATTPGPVQRAAAFFWLRLGLCAAVVGLGCALAGLLGERAFNGVDAGYLRWALLGVVATAASGAVSAMLQATGGFGRMSSLTLINTGLTAVLAAALAAIGQLDLLSALVVLGIGTSLATFLAGRAMLPRGWRLALPGLRELAHEATCLLQTGRWLWLASLFAVLTANAEVLLLNGWVALPLVGAYALALNLATKADLVNQSLYTVLLPGISRLGTPGQVRSYLRRGLVRSAAIALGLLALVPLSGPFILLVYGADFDQAVTFFRVLLGVVIFDVLLAPLLLLPLAYQQPRLLALADGMRALTLVLVALALIPPYGPFGAIAARFFSHLTGALATLLGLWSGRVFKKTRCVGGEVRARRGRAGVDS
jgi:O-antigen/teichoic acid export membrane protein